MKTLRLQVDPVEPDSLASRQAVKTAAEILSSGGLVALPTETVYGLGANALDAKAVELIFEAKRRPSWDPIIVHIAGPLNSNPMLAKIVKDVPESAQKLMQAFWPGPLTLLLPRSTLVPNAVTAGRPLVGVRMPAHPVALAVIQAAGVPVAAPSANVFGHISPTAAEHVLEDLDGRIDAILDAGPTEHGVESTVIDPNQSPMVIYRPGAVTSAQIEAIGGLVEVFQPDKPSDSMPREALPSPGVGIRHYAPKARLILVEASLEEMPGFLTLFVEGWKNEARIGFMAPAEIAGAGPVAESGATIFDWGRWDLPEELARNLYSGLRSLDSAGCTVILCPLPSVEGVGAAIRDRLRKAAWKPQSRTRSR